MHAIQKITLLFRFFIFLFAINIFPTFFFSFSLYDAHKIKTLNLVLGRALYHVKSPLDFVVGPRPCVGLEISASRPYQWMHIPFIHPACFTFYFKADLYICIQKCSNYFLHMVFKWCLGTVWGSHLRLCCPEPKPEWYWVVLMSFCLPYAANKHLKQARHGK